MPADADRHVVVVGRSLEKMREALAVLRAAGYTATGTYDGDQALAAVAAAEDLFAVVAGGSVGPELETQLRDAARAKGAGLVRANIGQDDPARHFKDHVLPQLRSLSLD